MIWNNYGLSYCHKLISFNYLNKFNRSSHFFCRVKPELTGADSEASPPQNNLAMKETFASKDTGKTFANTIKEVLSYKAASGIPVDGDPLAWWKAMSVNTLTLP